jgi:hypothetical protein
LKLVIALERGGSLQTKVVGSIVQSGWNSVPHPPLSYLGDDVQYRTADGSNNVCCPVNCLILECCVPSHRKGGNSICENCQIDSYSICSTTRGGKAIRWYVLFDMTDYSIDCAKGI